MIEIIISALLLLSALLIVVAAVGLLRMPDLPTRMHATTKSGVLAIILIMIAVALFFRETDITTRVLVIIIFIFLTAPIAAHAIGRAGYLSGVPLWSETVRDDLHDYYHGENNKFTKNSKDH